MCDIYSQHTLTGGKKNMMGKKKETSHGYNYGPNKKELLNGGQFLTPPPHPLDKSDGRMYLDMTQWPYSTHLSYTLMGSATSPWRNIFTWLDSLKMIQHRWELPVLTSHDFRVNHPYPFFGVIFMLNFHYLLYKITKKKSNCYPFFFLTVNYHSLRFTITVLKIFFPNHYPNIWQKG